VLAGVYNAGLDLAPARSLERFGDAFEQADYPVGTRRVTFGYGRSGSGRVLDAEVIVHVERT
jgi:hypothetical protein